MYDQVFRHLKPGGWFQHMEMSIEFKSDDDSLADESHIMRVWSRVFIEAGERMGKSFKVSPPFLTQDLARPRPHTRAF